MGSGQCNGSDTRCVQNAEIRSNGHDKHDSIESGSKIVLDHRNAFAVRFPNHFHAKGKVKSNRLLVARMAGGFELRAAAFARFVSEMFIELPGRSPPAVVRVDRDEVDVASRFRLRDETHEICCDGLAVLHDIRGVADFVDEDGMMQLEREIAIPVGAVIGDDPVEIGFCHLRDVHEVCSICASTGIARIIDSETLRDGSE